MKGQHLDAGFAQSGSRPEVSFVEGHEIFYQTVNGSWATLSPSEPEPGSRAPDSENGLSTKRCSAHSPVFTSLLPRSSKRSPFESGKDVLNSIGRKRRLHWRRFRIVARDVGKKRSPELKHRGIRADEGAGHPDFPAVSACMYRPRSSVGKKHEVARVEAAFPR